MSNFTTHITRHKRYNLTLSQQLSTLSQHWNFQQDHHKKYPKEYSDNYIKKAPAFADASVYMEYY